MVVGLLVQPKAAARLVDRGPQPTLQLVHAPDVHPAQNEYEYWFPSAPLSSSIAFRNFWGDEVCSLRRFEDGTVCESLVWRSSVPQSPTASGLRSLLGAGRKRRAVEADLKGNASSGIDAAPSACTMADRRLLWKRIAFHVLKRWFAARTKGGAAIECAEPTAEPCRVSAIGWQLLESLNVRPSRGTGTYNALLGF